MCSATVSVTLCVLAHAMRRSVAFAANARPLVSQLVHHRLQSCPPRCQYTSFFVRSDALIDDWHGKHVVSAAFSDATAWRVYKTNAAQYIKLYCTRSHVALPSATTENDIENAALGVLKALNLGVPFLLYGLAAPVFFKSILRIPHSALLQRDFSNYQVVQPSSPPRNDTIDLFFFYDVDEYERGAR